MKLVTLGLAVLLAFLFMPQTVTAQTQQKPVDLATKSAEAWLALTDSAKYGESWDEASTSFKNALSRDKWISMLQTTRSPLGAMKSRKLGTANYAKNPPNAPEGEYVIIQYSSSFEQLPAAAEIVSFVLDKDGKWRAAGYFIKPAQ